MLACELGSVIFMMGRNPKQGERRSMHWWVIDQACDVPQQIKNKLLIELFFFHSVVSWFIGVKSAARLLAMFFLLWCSNPSACMGLTTDTSDSLTSTASSLWSEKGSLVSMRIRNYLKDYIYMCDSKTKGCIKIVCLLAGGILSQFLGLMDTGGTRTVRRELQPVHMLFCVWL